MELAESAMGRMPKTFRKKLKNVSIIVEDYPTRDDARSVGAGRHDLLGLFTGTGYKDKGDPLNTRSMPDKVFLYQRNIQRFCSSKEELADEIGKTLFHEIGHYFGLSEEELRRYE